MDRLQGYNTNGHEYRISQIDRSNSKRLKWMMNEARKEVEKKDNESVNNKVMVDKNIKPTLHSNENSNNNIRKNMFDPSKVNKFSNFNNNRSID